MQYFKHYISLIALFLLATFGVSAQNDVCKAENAEAESALQFDSLHISLITCSPGYDAYTHFGHTALRVINYKNGDDIIFNYGCFDPSMDNFILKFMAGETDYILGAEYASTFIERYREMGTEVVQQDLNLTKEEANRLFLLLLDNIRPENQQYRYNWLYDNCTERARDVIIKAISKNNDVPTGNEVVYLKQGIDITTRQMIHECTERSPWFQFGIDLLLGTEIDQHIERDVWTFIPAYYMAEADSAIIRQKAIAEDSNATVENCNANAECGSNTRPLISAKHTLLSKTALEEEPFSPTPMTAFGAILLIAILLSGFDYSRRKQSLWFDIAIHTAQGIAGLIVSYLFFFSVHPGVDTNHLVFIFNPLAFLYIAWLVWGIKAKALKRYASLIQCGIAYLLVFYFAYSWVGEQNINIPTECIILTLTVRALLTAELTRQAKSTQR